MTWLIEDQEINPSLSLKRLMKDNDIIPVAGVYNPICALLARKAGFQYINIQKFKELGYKFAIFPVTALRLSNKTVLEGFKNILTSGTQKEIISKMQTRQELYELIKYKEYENLNKGV